MFEDSDYTSKLLDYWKIEPHRRIVRTSVSLTAREQTSMLVCRGEVREFGLTGLTRNQVSLTAPGVRIPPSPPPQFGMFPYRMAANKLAARGFDSLLKCLAPCCESVLRPQRAAETSVAAYDAVLDSGIALQNPMVAFPALCMHPATLAL